METKQQLTHWRKLTNVNYLGSYSLTPGEDMILTIKSCAKEMVAGPNGKEEECPVMHFVEPVKPMIMNKTNLRTITKLFGTPYIEQWAGKKIQIYSAQVSAFGTTTDALRIRDYQPKTKEVDPTPALVALDGCQSKAELQKTYLSLTKSEQAHPEVIKRKDELKAELV